MPIRRVLLVDDEPDIRAIGAMSLRRVGKWEVELADSGEAALLIARAAPPDVVLLDVMMPGLGGPETMAAMRADPALSGVAIIVMSATLPEADVARYRSLGAAGTIEKPFDPLELPAQIRAIVESAQRSE